VTKADDGSGELILRFYESAGAATTARIVIPCAAEAWASDLRERRAGPVSCREGVIEVPVGPFEITTLRVRERS
jgi:alpha-mannosidase